MLRIVDKFLHDKYVAKYGYIGVYLSVSAIHWHHLKWGDDKPIVIGSGSVKLNNDMSQLERELGKLLAQFEQKKAMVNIALANDVCKYIVIPFDNLPESKKDCHQYVRWSYSKQFKNNTKKSDFSNNISVGRFCQKKQQVFVEVSSLPPETSEILVRLCGSNKLVQSVSPFPCYLSPKLFNHNIADGQSFVVFIGQSEQWQYVWMEGENVLHYRSNLWLNNLEQSVGFIKKDLCNLIETMSGGKEYKSYTIFEKDSYIDDSKDVFPEKNTTKTCNLESCSFVVAASRLTGFKA